MSLVLYAASWTPQASSEWEGIENLHKYQEFVEEFLSDPSDSRAYLTYHVWNERWSSLDHEGNLTLAGQIDQELASCGKWHAGILLTYL